MLGAARSTRRMTLMVGCCQCDECGSAADEEDGDWIVRWDEDGGRTVLTGSRGMKMIVIGSKSGRRMGRMMFIGGSGKTVLIGCTHCQDGRTMRTMEGRWEHRKTDQLPDIITS